VVSWHTRTADKSVHIISCFAGTGMGEDKQLHGARPCCLLRSVQEHSSKEPPWVWPKLHAPGKQMVTAKMDGYIRHTGAQEHRSCTGVQERAGAAQKRPDPWLMWLCVAQCGPAYGTVWPRIWYSVAFDSA